MSYIGTEPKDIRSFGRTKFDYTATQGQTAFTGADDDGKVLAFTVGQIEVYVNGILMDDSDFTTTGTGTVTLASAANLNDVINIVSFETNIPDSNYVPASGGTFTGDVTITGNANDANGNLKVTTNTPANYPAMVIETSTGGNGTEVHGLHIKNTAAGHGLRIDDESSDTTPFVVASDGKVGIGTTSPDEKLHVEGSILVDAFNAGNETGIFFREGFTSSNKYNHSILAYDTDGSPDGLSINGYGGVSICTGSNSRQERFKVNNSGQMTVPNQPMFKASINTSAANPRTTTNTIYVTPYDTTQLNVGNHYNTSNYRFTAPVAGNYWFSISQNKIGMVIVYFYKNGNVFHAGEFLQDSAPNWEHCTISCMIPMAASDYVEARTRLNNNSGTQYGFNGGSTTWDSFSGYLVG